MDTTTALIYDAHALVARASNATSSATATEPTRPPIYKVIGLSLAILSGLLIGTSFVLKKVGLLRANAKYNEEAGEGYGYLKNVFWWGGMSLMILGEICNFVAYAFVDAILVTPLGALSVVVTTILSAIFLKERLSFVGKIGCFNCIIGSVVIVLNAPQQSAVANIQQMKTYVLSPGFLSYAGVVVVACAFIALWVAPRYGKKSMLVYLTICSLIGGLSVVATQGLGSAIVAQAGGKPQFNQWFLYVLLVFVAITLVTEIIYLNKALNLFNAALVTPTYYVIFTSATIITSAILFRGFHGTAISITTVVMGFLQICAGVVLLQLSKSAKDVPDAAVFKGDLDQVREVAEQEQPETDPKADAIRGAAALVRRFSSARLKMEQREFERLHQEKMQDHLEPLRENEIVEWDGLRRRKTIIGDPGIINSPIQRRKTIHPPLGMSYFPNDDDDHDEQQSNATQSGIFDAIRDRASTMLHIPGHRKSNAQDEPHSPMDPVAMTNIEVNTSKTDQSTQHMSGNIGEPAEHVLGLPPGLRKSSRDKRTLFSSRSKPLPLRPEPSPHGTLSPPSSARRQFSFTNMLHRSPRTPIHDGIDEKLPPPRSGPASRGSSHHHEQRKAMKNATEEERLGLVKGDSSRALLDSSPERPPLQPVVSQSLNLSPSNISISSVDDFLSKSQGRGRADVTDSDDDDEWQMTDRPYGMPKSTVPVTQTMTQRTENRTNPSSTNYSSVTTASNASRPSSRRRPSPPRNYVPQVTAQQPQTAWPLQVPPPVQQKPIPAPIRDQTQGLTQTSASLEKPRTDFKTRMQGQEMTLKSARPAVAPSGHFQNSSMSQYHTNLPPPRLIPSEAHTDDETVFQSSDDDQDEENNLAAGRQLQEEQAKKTTPRTLYGGDGWGSPMSTETPIQEQQEIDALSREKFKEQSQREREKRRKRMSTGPKDPRGFI